MNEQQRATIERIKKCLALAKSSNPNEAVTALRQAQMLMQRCGLTAADIGMADIGETARLLSASKLPAWHHWLIRIIAEAFGCDTMIATIWSSGKRSHIKFIGTAARTEIAAYTYTVLYRHIRGARAAFIAKLPARCKTRTKTLRADSYCEGFVAAVAAKVSALALEPEETQALAAYVARHYPAAQKSTAARSADKDTKARNKQPDYSNQGYRDGSKVALHRAMHGTTQARLEQAS